MILAPFGGLAGSGGAAVAAPTAGGLAAGFFRAILQGDEQALVDATNVDNIPVPATVDTTL